MITKKHDLAGFLDLEQNGMLCKGLILTVVSDQVGPAMENARLYQRLQEKVTLTASRVF